MLFDFTSIFNFHNLEGVTRCAALNISLLCMKRIKTSNHQRPKNNTCAVCL